MLDKNFYCVHNIDKKVFFNLKEKILVNDMIFKIKNEFHITIFGHQIGSKFKELENTYPDLRNFIESKLEKFIWNITFYNEFYVIKAKNEANVFSIIQKIEAKEIIDLFEELNKKYNELNLLKPFPHITLFTHNKDKGIGINNEKEFLELKIDLLTKNKLINF
ncbi:MAG: hypothetical protein U0457_11155 [Candidatus Sericytochromatia bacterium]